MEELALAYSSGGGVHADPEGVAADSKNRKLTDHICSSSRKQKSVLEAGQEEGRTMNSQSLLPVMYFLQPCRIPSPTAPPAIDPSVQIPKPTRGISFSNYPFSLPGYHRLMATLYAKVDPKSKS